MRAENNRKPGVYLLPSSADRCLPGGHSTEILSLQIHILSRRCVASVNTALSELCRVGSALSVTVILLAFLALGCSREDPTEKFQKLMQKAKDYSTQEKWEEARISLMSASELKPQDANVYYELAEVFVRQQRFDRAIENYRAAINYDPSHKNARLHLATLLLAAREFELAEDQIKKLLETHGDDPEVQLLSANLEAGSPRKNTTGAKKIYEQILGKDPKNVGAVAGLGSLALNDGDLKGAEDYFLKALALEPKNTPLKMVLADLYSRQGRLDEAQTIVEGLLKENPDNAGLRFGFGEFLLKRGLADKAISQYEEILKTEPLKHEARDRLYDMYLVRKENDKAKQLTAAIVAAQPDQPGTQYFQGRDAELSGNTSEAMSLYTKALIGLPKFAAVFRRVGLLELAAGDDRNGLQHLNQAIAIDPGDVGARLALARNALGQQNVAQATEHVNQILQRFPRQLGANVLRADIAVIEGNTELARKVYQYLIDGFPNHPTGYFKLGLLEEKEKNFDKAMELYKKTISFDTDVLLPAQRLVGLLVMKNGLDKTIEEMKKLQDQSEKSKPEFNLILGTLALTNTSDAQRMTKARELLTKAVEERPTLVGAYFALAAIDAQQGDLDAAAANYEKLIVQNPKHVPSHMLLALARERQGKFEDAATAYRRVLDVAPRFAPAANNLAWLLADRLNGDLDEALKLAQMAKEVLPNEGSVADTLGWVHYKRGSKQVALSFLKEAVEHEKKDASGRKMNPEILYHLAQVEADTGEKAQAKAHIEEAIGIAGENHPLTKELKEFLGKLG